MIRKPGESLPTIKGFDPNGEPKLHITDDGRLGIAFSMFPPETANGSLRKPELFEQFERTLSRHLGVVVTRDDREVFLIRQPEPDTATIAARFLSDFWSDHAPQLASSQPSVATGSVQPFGSNSELANALIGYLRPPLKKLGFTGLRKAELMFIRKVPAGSQMLSSPYRFQSSSNVTSSIACRRNWIATTPDRHRRAS